MEAHLTLSGRGRHRWEEVIEILEVVVLAMAAIATAWSGYQAARGDGQQSVLYSDASVDRIQANTATRTRHRGPATCPNITTRRWSRPTS